MNLCLSDTSPRGLLLRRCGKLPLIALAVLPTSLSLVPDVAEFLFYLLAACGGALIFRESHRTITGGTCLLGVLTLAVFASTVLSIAVSNDLPGGFDRLDRYAHFLVAPLIALLLERLRTRPATVALAIKLNTLCLLSVSAYQALSGIPRPGGAINPLLFGLLALLLAFFSLVRLPVETRRQKLLSLSAFVGGCSACLLSQSRGVWLAAPLLLIALFYVWHRSGHLTKSVALLTSAVFLIISSAAINLPFAQQRARVAFHEYQGFQQQGVWQNSVGLRLTMWESGLKAALQNPVLGWGPHRTQLAAASRLDTASMQQRILEFTHLHNEYITTLTGRGIIGLFCLLALLFVPLGLFVRQANDPEHLLGNGIGVLLCLGYAVCSLTNLSFGHPITNIFFLGSLSLVLASRGEKPLRSATRAPQHRHDTTTRDELCDRDAHPGP